jgi:hypothetical protein
LGDRCPCSQQQICAVGANRSRNGAAQPWLSVDELDDRAKLGRKPTNTQGAPGACARQARRGSYHRRHRSGDPVHQRRRSGGVCTWGLEGVFKLLDDPDKLSFWHVFFALDDNCPKRGIHHGPADRIMTFQSCLDSLSQFTACAVGNASDTDMHTPARTPQHTRRLLPPRRMQRAGGPPDCPDEPSEPWHCWQARCRATRPWRTLPVGKLVETCRHRHRVRVSFAHLDMVSRRRPTAHHPTW